MSLGQHSRKLALNLELKVLIISLYNHPTFLIEFSEP